MRLLKLSLENIGPFDRAELQFLENPEDPSPVAIITGINGTGKSILVDAIRGIFGEDYATLERRIWRENISFQIDATFYCDGKLRNVSCDRGASKEMGQYVLRPNNSRSIDSRASVLQRAFRAGNDCPHWIVNYWRPTLGQGLYEIPALKAPNHQRFLAGSLQGTLLNAEITELITYYDYLRSSGDPSEKATGQAFYELASKIVRLGLLDGELQPVKRSTLMPMILQSGHVVPIANISSGNVNMIQRMVSILGKMFSVHTLLKTNPKEAHRIPGILLIDEIENHLHPLWQKRFLPGIRDIFPNLQIILTTHSPFVLASIPDARVFVCKYDRAHRNCIVVDESDDYSNKPIEEILLTPAFDATQPWSSEISELVERHKQALQSQDEAERRRIEAKLKELNPNYFGYFDLEEKLAALKRGVS